MIFRWAWLFILAGVLSASHSPLLDLDVAIPSGTPVEWVRELPSSTPRHGGMVPTQVVKDQPDASTQVMDGAPLEAALPNSFGLIRILTWDLTSHLAWVNPRPGEIEETGSGDLRGPAYPPEVTSLTYWMCLATFLRAMLHPAQTSEPELVQYLTEIGEPSINAAEHSKDEPLLKALAEKVLLAIPPLPPQRPSPKKGKDVVESMLYRFTMEELTADYPCNPDMKFGYRLYLLGDDAYPFVAAYAKDDSAHLFLRRNSVHALGQYKTAESLTDALEVFGGATDPVVRNRALSVLIKFRHRPAAKTILKAIKKVKDPGLEVYYLYALGMLGDEEALPVLLSAAKSVDQPAVLWGALPALGRIPLSDEKDRKKAISCANGVRKAVAEIASKIDPPEPPPGMNKPDVPDKPGLRAEILMQMCLLAAAGQGDAKSIDEVLQILQQKPEPPAAGRVRTIRDEALGGFHPPTHYLLIDVLKKIGEKALPALEKIVRDDTTDVMVRVYALHALPRVTHADLIREIAAAGKVTPMGEKGEVEKKIRDLCDRACKKEEIKKEEIDALLDEIIKSGVNPQLTAATKENYAKSTESYFHLIAAAKEEDKAEQYTTALISYLLARANPGPENMGVPAPLRIYALKALVQMEDKEAGSIARGIIEKLDAARLKQADWKYLAITAIDALCVTGQVTPELLVDLLGKIEVRKLEKKDGKPKDDPKKQAYKMIDAIIEMAKQGKDWTKALDDLLDFVVREKINPNLNRENAKTAIKSYLDVLKANKDNAQMIASYRHYIEQQVFGFGGDPTAEFQKALDPPIVPAILIALGRTGHPDAVKKIVEWLTDPLNPGRAEACLGLGAAHLPEGRPALLDALDEDDGFVRYCAYAALKANASVDAPCDWIYGSKPDRAAAVKKAREQAGTK